MKPFFPDYKELRISNQYTGTELIRDIPCTNIGRDGKTREYAEHTLIEHVIDVFVNERLTMKLICIPQHLAELVIGRLFTEGIITQAGDISAFHICESGRRARVYLKDIPGFPANSGTMGEAVSGSENDNGTEEEIPDFVELTPSCCTGNRILNDYFVGRRELSPVVPISWKSSWIFALADRFKDGMPLHGQTWCTHSCFLAYQDQLLFQCEDIGRHNALDKAIGYALLHGIDLSQCIVYLSGRVPTEMVFKAVISGIPVLASKASPTAEAVRLAKDYHLTLVCAARPDRMRLFAGDPPIRENH